MITRFLHLITDTASSRRGKFVTIAFWFVAVALFIGLAPKLADVYNNSAQQVPSSDDSQVAAQLLLKKFPSSRGIPAILVFTDANGLTSDDRARARQISDWLTSSQKPVGVDGVISIFTTPQAASQLLSTDGTTMTMVVNFPASASTTVSDAVKIIRTRLNTTTQGSALHTYVTGPAGIVVDTLNVFTSGNVDLTLATVVLVLILLLIVYRSPILALLPLLAVGVVLQIVDAVLALLAKGGVFPVSQQASSIATVLLFGAGTDYSIFIISRFREELRHTQDKHTAMQTTMRAVGEAITSSAGSVILALVTLLVATLTLYSSLGPTMAVTIAVMLLAGLTLVPALLTVLGRAAYWPFAPRFTPTPNAVAASTHTATPPVRGFWRWLGGWTARHRILAVTGSVLLLLVLALGNLGIVRSYNFLTSFRVATDSTTGFAILERHFPAGTLAPTTVLIQLPGNNTDPYQYLAQIDAVTAALSRIPGVAEAQGPTRPDGKAPAIAPATLQAQFDALPSALKMALRSGSFSAASGTAQGPSDPQLAAIIGAYAASVQYISPDNTTVQLTVTFTDDPYALPAINRIANVRAAVEQALRAQGLATAQMHIAGQTSLLADTQAADARDTHIIVPVVLLLVALVLALLLRSLIAPIYLLAAVTLNFFAAIGLCSFIFQRVQGQDGIFYAIPLYTFIFLVALGADYTIFLMSRVREEAARRGLEAGVPVAVAQTGGVITSAGLILAGTFAVLTTLPLTLLYQFGVCVAVGVLLDTFVVRGLLVPGIVLLLGRWNWWPGKLPAATLATGSSPVNATDATTEATTAGA